MGMMVLWHIKCGVPRAWCMPEGKCILYAVTPSCPCLNHFIMHWISHCLFTIQICTVEWISSNRIMSVEVGPSMGSP